MVVQGEVVVDRHCKSARGIFGIGRVGRNAATNRREVNSQFLADLHRQEGDQVGVLGKPRIHSVEYLGRNRRTPEHRTRFEDRHPPARHRQVAGGHQTVMATSDDHAVSCDRHVRFPPSPCLDSRTMWRLVTIEVGTVPHAQVAFSADSRIALPGAFPWGGLAGLRGGGHRDRHDHQCCQRDGKCCARRRSFRRTVGGGPCRLAAGDPGSCQVHLLSVARVDLPARRSRTGCDQPAVLRQHRRPSPVLRPHADPWRHQLVPHARAIRHIGLVRRQREPAASNLVGESACRHRVGGGAYRRRVAGRPAQRCRADAYRRRCLRGSDPALPRQPCALRTAAGRA